MKHVWLMFKREVFAMFVSPLATMLLVVWLFWCGASFSILTFNRAQDFTSSALLNPLVDFFGGTVFFYLPLFIFVPIITMRLFAEESRSGIMDVHLSSPIAEWALVLGKFLSALFFWVVMWLPTLIYVWLIRRFGDVDQSALLSTYLGLFIMGAHYMAAGLFMSALTHHQLVAAVLTFFWLALLFTLGIVEFVAIDDGLQDLAKYFNVWSHMQSFAQGVVDSRYVVFNLSLSIFFLFSTMVLIRFKRMPS